MIIEIAQIDRKILDIMILIVMTLIDQFIILKEKMTITPNFQIAT